MIKFVKKVMKRVHDRNEKRKACIELNKFSDRDLEDLGVSRAEIYNRVYQLDKMKKS
jgi:uncharacterized protein YjiS (DUF1127 family)